MKQLHMGKHSFFFPDPPVITAWAAVAGQKEAEGPLGGSFDALFPDSYAGQKTWEQGEQVMQQTALRRLLRKGGMAPEQLGAVFSGDLLNQCIVSSFSLRNAGIPHFGLYGACSTMAEALVLGAMAVGGGFLPSAAAMTSSHFCTSERQYRFPLGYGGQRTPTSQWTVTGSGAALLEHQGAGPRIRSCTVGTVQDLGIRDANNMGAAMAVAAWDTIKTHLEDTHSVPQDYDRIYTGDLGQLGKEILMELAGREGISLGGVLEDCGCMIYDNTAQDVGAGGSGCGCSALVLCSTLLNQLSRGSLKRILFCGTGALLSPVSTQQGQPIPGICHAVEIEGGSL